MKAALALLALPALSGCFAFAVPVPVGDRPALAATAHSDLAGQTIGASAFAGPWDLVTFETNSWGHPLSSWQLMPDGSGNWVEAVRDEGAMPGDYRLSRHELEPDPAAYARLRTVIEALPLSPPSRENCASFITDQPYGTLRLQKGERAVELAFNLGCRDEAYRRFLAGLRQADDLVTPRGRAIPGAVLENPAASSADPAAQPISRSGQI